MAEQTNGRCCPFECDAPQRHVHEFLGSAHLAELEEDPHNHRFAGVSSQAILIGGGQHVHKLLTNTDFYEDHYHAICEITGPAIPVSAERHVHFVEGTTTTVDGHAHAFILATLIENPIGD